MSGMKIDTIRYNSLLIGYFFSSGESSNIKADNHKESTFFPLSFVFSSTVELPIGTNSNSIESFSALQIK